ncbi:MAG: hypothetical protein V1648_01150 [Candidatus Aenigmatarchaeota archaeon]
MGTKEKIARYNDLMRYLQDIPTYIQSGDAKAIDINKSLANAGFNPHYAIEGCHFLLKKELKEVKTKKFDGSGGGGGGGGKGKGGFNFNYQNYQRSTQTTTHNTKNRNTNVDVHDNPVDVELHYHNHEGNKQADPDKAVGAATGIISDLHGSPVDGAIILIDVNGTHYKGTSGKNGKFFIPDIPAGRIPWQPAVRVKSYKVSVTKEYTDEFSTQVREVSATASVVVSAGEVSPTDPDVIKLEIKNRSVEGQAKEKNRSREEQIKDYLDGKGERPDSTILEKGPGRALGKATKGSRLISDFSRKTGHGVNHIISSLVLVIIGIAISAYTSNIWYLIGFIFWGFHMILPNPKENKLDAEEFTTFGSLFTNTENRTNTGIAFLKAVAMAGIVVCFIGGLYSQQFPGSNLLLLFLAFGFYFKMPIEFEPSKPYDFILSFVRVLLALFIAFFIFGVLGGGIFQSKELGWLTLAFFVVLPVATEKNNLAKALGKIGNASGASYDMIDKVVFVAIMVIFAVIGGFNLAGGFFSGTGGIVFSAVWILGLVAGLTTPAETRPWMGVIILVIGFVIFGLGSGQQSVGVAFFGEWWPSVHNGVNDFFKPMGDMFGQFQNTFGQGWMLFTNPVGYAQQITNGQYAQNEMGISGAYGLEIRKFDVHPIYLGEPFLIEMELENKGQFHAKNVRIDLLTTIRDFKIGHNTVPTNKMEKLPKNEKTNEQWYRFTMDKNYINQAMGINIEDIEMKETIPILLYGKLECEDFRSTAWNDFGFIGGQEHTVREKYIPFMINVTYEYESTSNLQIDFISDQEWKRLSSEDKLVRAQKPSLLSTSPANLNLGSMDQPIKASTGFYIGFNLSTTWDPKNTAVSNAKVSLNVTKDLGEPTCTRSFKFDLNNKDANVSAYIFELGFSNDGVCSYNGISRLEVPKKTYTITASATYSFTKKDTKDTLITFNDICWPKELAQYTAESGSDS